jgi:hypothetical protein
MSITSCTIYIRFSFVSFVRSDVATPLWGKCEDETCTPKSGNLESSETPKNSQLDCRGQNTSPWGVLYIIGKVVKCRCRKWPRMRHFDICSTSYGRKKGQESNWQFDSQPLKVENRPDPGVCRWSATHRWKAIEKSYKFSSDLVLIRGLKVWAESYELLKSQESKPGQFRDSSLGVPGQKAIWM